MVLDVLDHVKYTSAKRSEQSLFLFEKMVGKEITLTSVKTDVSAVHCSGCLCLSV